MKFNLFQKLRRSIIFSNLKIYDIVTPVKADNLARLLHQANYPQQKIDYLVNGFTNGFDIGYRGPVWRQNSSANIPFSIGDKYDMWNKLMKEVKIGWVAGPFENVPFTLAYVQSPIGLVAKAGNKTRLIFHLSYDFSEDCKSINHHIPDEFCTVKYKGLDFAVKTCLLLLQKRGLLPLFFSKTDVMSAFRLALILPSQRFLLCMKAYHPTTNIPFRR